MIPGSAADTILTEPPRLAYPCAVSALPSPPVTALFAELLRRGEPVRFRARGASMSPSVRHGDIVRIAPAGLGALRLGDVVCYEPASGGLALHRVCSVGPHAVAVRGDALAYRETVEPIRVLGALVAVERAGRILRLDTPAARLRGRLTVHLAPLMRVVLTVVWRIAAFGWSGPRA
jgi:hypothetical protein